MGSGGSPEANRGADSAPDARKYWLFYAGPENYLSEAGLLELPRETFWSCEPQTSEGDLILVYRKSMSQLSVDRLVQQFGMPRHVATAVKRTRVGKDFPVLWRAVSSAQQQPSWHWPYGCQTTEIQQINPPLLLEELKAEPQLRKWEDLRWNLQARGRSALEIPEFAWSLIVSMIQRKPPKPKDRPDDSHEP